MKNNNDYFSKPNDNKFGFNDISSTNDDLMRGDIGDGFNMDGEEHSNRTPLPPDPILTANNMTPQQFAQIIFNADPSCEFLSVDNSLVEGDYHISYIISH